MSSSCFSDFLSSMTAVYPANWTRGNSSEVRAIRIRRRPTEWSKVRILLPAPLLAMRSFGLTDSPPRSGPKKRTGDPRKDPLSLSDHSLRSDRLLALCFRVMTLPASSHPIDLASEVLPTVLTLPDSTGSAELPPVHRGLIPAPLAGHRLSHRGPPGRRESRRLPGRGSPGHSFSAFAVCAASAEVALKNSSEFDPLTASQRVRA